MFHDFEHKGLLQLQLEGGTGGGMAIWFGLVDIDWYIWFGRMHGWKIEWSNDKMIQWCNDLMFKQDASRERKDVHITSRIKLTLQLQYHSVAVCINMKPESTLLVRATTLFSDVGAEILLIYSGADLAFQWGGGVKFDKKDISLLRGRGSRPRGNFWLPNVLSCNLRHIGHCFSLGISLNHKETPKKGDDFFMMGGGDRLNPPNHHPPLDSPLIISLYHVLYHVYKCYWSWAHLWKLNCTNIALNLKYYTQDKKHSSTPK